MRNRVAFRLAALAFALSCPLAVGPARAGDADHEIIDDHEDGPPFFGEAKDVAGLKPLADVRIKTTLAGTMRFLMGSSDQDGRFKIRGLGHDVSPDNVVVTCEKPGYRTIDVMRRRVTKADNAPTEVECLMEKAGAKATP